MKDKNEMLQEPVEERAQAIGQLAYLKAKHMGATLSRLHNSKALYFALCGDAVKIGISNFPEDRLEQIQVGAPGKLCLLAVLPGLGKREAECHARMAHLHIHGEWFRYTEETDQLIEELQDG